MRAYEAIDNALEMLKTRGIMGGDVYDDLAAVRLMLQRRLSIDWRTELPEREVD